MNPRSAQLLTAALGTLLVVLIGATVFVLVSRPRVGPTPSPSLLTTPTPTTVALVTPSPSAAQPTATLAPTPAPTPETTLAPTVPLTFPPTPTPSPTPTRSPTPEPTPTPTPAPTISPTTPARLFRVVGVGLDANGLEGSVPRVLTFTVEGQSHVSARVSDASGQVQLCLWRESFDDLRRCRTARSVTLGRDIFDTGPTVWHASIIGAVGVTPSATLTVRFNASSASVSLDNFRYNGPVDAHYNGFEAHFSGGPGQTSVRAAFDDGASGQYNYHLLLRNAAGDVVLDESSAGPVPSVDSTAELPAPGDYVVELRNPDTVVNVFIAATVAWP